MSDITSPITLELLRAQLQSIAEQSADTAIRTAISPVVNEAKDCGAMILDPDGDLVTGGGMATTHWLGAVRAVKATMEAYGDRVGPGDVFIANDPYNGGGMHPADVMIQRPIFLGDVCIGWAALSAHMIDMGGMSIGSWAPTATECYQEALRIPPVRLIKGGVDVQEVWDLMRINIRFATLVEMDIRSLIAGTFVASERLCELVADYGVEDYRLGIKTLIDLSEAALRRRIREIEPGEYHTVGWTEWGDKFVKTPCRMIVDDGRLIFDFTGADPQIPFFINTQPYIIKTMFMPQLIATLAPDLPFNEGVLRPIELICPEGTVVHSTPPAPINCAHIHLSGTAAEAMYRCLRLAVWATPALYDSLPGVGAEGFCALTSNSWYGEGPDGPESWMVVDGCMTGGCAFEDADGVDYAMKSLDLPNRDQVQPNVFDVETYETWFPMMMRERRLTPGAYGAGRWRAGAALTHSFEPYGAETITGQMLGTRGHLPLGGEAGGAPGAVTKISIRGVDGALRPVAIAGADVVVRAGEMFELRSASAGGWGDALERPADEVAEDVRQRRLTQQDAGDIYGLVLTGERADESATAARRDAIRRQRLADAIPAAVTPAPAETTASVEETPLYPGVVQRGDRAYAKASGALLAVAPAHWTDGCPTIETQEEAYGSGVTRRAYLDPLTGAALYVEAVPNGNPRAFASLPARWLRAA